MYFKAKQNRTNCTKLSKIIFTVNIIFVDYHFFIQSDAIRYNYDHFRFNFIYIAFINVSVIWLPEVPFQSVQLQLLGLYYFPQVSIFYLELLPDFSRDVEIVLGNRNLQTYFFIGLHGSSQI